MSWVLPFLFVQLIATVRDAKGLAGIIPEPTWTLLVVSLALLLMSVMASRRLLLSLLKGKRFLDGARVTTIGRERGNSGRIMIGKTFASCMKSVCGLRKAVHPTVLEACLLVMAPK